MQPAEEASNTRDDDELLFSKLLSMFDRECLRNFIPYAEKID